MGKYQDGDIVNYFEGDYWIYGFDKPLNLKSKTIEEWGLEFHPDLIFENEFRPLSHGYYRVGSACKELNEDGYKFQWHLTSKHTGYKGRGAMPITIWTRKESY